MSQGKKRVQRGEKGLKKSKHEVGGSFYYGIFADDLICFGDSMVYQFKVSFI